ncbi:PilW family protein [Halopseudomonas yangmingensis]|uniref:Type IV pilus assembly protein PilW n=1 Tax=Halopseudomonas yangmingensis TaxID=1720063 RepID=A0A1I4P1E5_9GAMM|nr:prepilin-type N-terminal cleavage/methylation domain-containing protein [Halopseudomonas yangmingensis]SFM21347.1 type IV pilus assembly protein PilW [Halopseudomonas yangmingensis]
MPEPCSLPDPFTCPANRGFSLVELMVAMLLSVGLLMAAVQLLPGGSQSLRLQQESARMQEDARFVLQRLAGELRMTASPGCLHLPTLPQNLREQLLQPVNLDPGPPLRLSLLTLAVNQAGPLQGSAGTAEHAARWVVVTDCRGQQQWLDQHKGGGRLAVAPGDWVMALRQLEYRWQGSDLQVRINGAGTPVSLIEGVADFAVDFGVVGAAGGHPEYHPALASTALPHSVRVQLSLQAPPGPQPGAAAQRHVLVTALRNAAQEAEHDTP